MPYEQLEEIRSRKQEKIALFLTAQHMAGLLCVALPAYIATLHFAFVLRALILVTAAFLGICLTLEIGGLPFYERLLWRVRGAIRVRTSSKTVGPEHFTSVPMANLERALPAGGPIRVVQAEERASKRRLHLGYAASETFRSVTSPATRMHAVACPTMAETAVFPTDVDMVIGQPAPVDGAASPQVSEHANI